MKIATRAGRPGGRPAAWTWIVGAAVVALIAGGLVAADRAWQAGQRVDPADPATRVAGAVRSISGSNSVRRVTYDETTSSARVEVTSRYYDAAKPIAENQEYLATEGRLAAQLALHGNAAVEEVTIRLYTRRMLLATVTARQGQAYEGMKVEYSGPLAPP
jgi:hypothetical protein